MKDSHCFRISGTAPLFTSQSDLDQNFNKGDSIIHAPSGGALGSISPGEWIHFIKHKFDYIPGPGEPDEAEIVGQITRLEAKGTDGNGDWGEIKDVANMYYIDSQDTEYSLKVRKVTPVQNIGIEDLTIKRYPSEQATDDDENQVYTINLTFAVNCWVKGVELYKASRNHLNISYSSHIEISGCYIHEAEHYGDGGWGYGVQTYGSSTNCLIENNIFRKLRHAMVAGGGSNCNVWTFNYSREPTNVGIPGFPRYRDMDLHAKYPFGHLFEHNVVKHIEAHDHHGLNGPYNAFVRNAAYDYDSKTYSKIILRNAPEASVLGCDLMDDSGPSPIELHGTSTLVTDIYSYFQGDYRTHGYVDEFPPGVRWQTHLEDVSYYYSSRPGFLPTQYTWPSQGPAYYTVCTQSIPAVDRWLSSSKKTYLADPTPKPLIYAGDVYYDQTWSGTHTLTGDVTVLPNVILTIAPGTTVRIPDNKRILIQGTLTAGGTAGNPVTFQKSGSGRWYGIEVNSGTLDLDYTTVKESWYGVTVYNAYNPNIWYSTITNNYYRNLRFDNISGGTVGYTTISNATYDGIQCVQYASPTLKPYNNIKGHMNGVQGDNTSLPYLGQSPDQGLNDITNNWDFDIYSDNSNTLYAHYNWWGSSSPSPSVSDDVSWQPYLTYDPTAGKVAIAQESGSSSPRQTTAQDTTGRAGFRQAYAAYLAGDFDAALAAFESVTDTYPDSPAGKQALAFSLRSLQKLGRSADVTTFLQTKRNTFTGKEIAGLAASLATAHLIRAGQYRSAIEHATAVVQQFPATRLHRYALYDLGTIPILFTPLDS